LILPAAENDASAGGTEIEGGGKNGTRHGAQQAKRGAARRHGKRWRSNASVLEATSVTAEKSPNKNAARSEADGV
jgi:hypothetical protein